MAKSQKPAENAAAAAAETIETNVINEQAAETAETEAAAENEPTSEKLESLTAQLGTVAANMASLAVNPTSKAFQAAAAEFLNVQNQIAAEKASIGKAIADAKLLELRNERIQLATDLKLAAIAFGQSENPETEAAMNTAFDIVTTELLAKYAGSKAAKASIPSPSGNGTEAKSGSGLKAEIEQIAITSGKRHAELQAMGYARSTVWFALDEAVKAGRMVKNW